MKVNKNLYNVLCGYMMLFACAVYAQEDEDFEEMSFVYNKTVVPLVRVIANPEKFEGKLITVSGYYHLETHLSAVFLDRDSCLYYATENSILLDGSQSRDNYKHCDRIEVQGRLKHSRDYYGMRYQSDLYLKDTKFEDFTMKDSK